MARPKSPVIAARDDEIYARSKAGPYELATLAKDYGITPQRVGQILAARDGQVYAAWKTGRFTLADLAEEYRLSPEQVAEVVSDRHPPPASEEAGRSVLRARLERFMIAVQEVVENPGYKLAPNGRLACDDDGKPLVDIGAKIEAMKLQLSAFERASRLDGGDKPQQSKVTHEIADQKRIEDITRRKAEFEELARRAGQQAIPGEVIARELPAGQSPAA